MAKKTITTPYDVAEHLRTPKERAAYLQAMIEEFEGDPRHIMEALGDIARSEGMTHVARESGVSRESLYKSLSGTRSPEFSTILKVMAALGLQFQVVARVAR
jgi:probable addiction module antidote protein